MVLLVFDTCFVPKEIRCKCVPSPERGDNTNFFSFFRMIFSSRQCTRRSCFFSLHSIGATCLCTCKKCTRFSDCSVLCKCVFVFGTWLCKCVFVFGTWQQVSQTDEFCVNVSFVQDSSFVVVVFQTVVFCVNMPFVQDSGYFPDCSVLCKCILGTGQQFFFVLFWYRTTVCFFSDCSDLCKCVFGTGKQVFQTSVLCKRVFDTGQQVSQTGCFV